MLGPLLFNIFLNDLFYFINRANLSNYADDNQIYFSDRDPEVVKSVINGDLAVASRWFDDNKLALNPEKCKCIILPKNYPCDLSFSISDVQVPIVDHLELLGVTIDNSLNFSKHIGKITNGMLPGYISDLFAVRNNVKCSRGTNKLVVPRKKTTNFGLKCGSVEFFTG